jgi:hypothetical protein
MLAGEMTVMLAETNEEDAYSGHACRIVRSRRDLDMCRDTMTGSGKGCQEEGSEVKHLGRR